MRVEAYEHSYPHCWRCGTPLIYWAKPTWFARTSANKDDAAARERGHQLAPRAHQARALRRLAREQRRLGVLAETASGARRSRCGAARTAATTPASARWPSSPSSPGATSRELDLHRPYVDDVVIECPECEAVAACRVEPVLDAWFDSARCRPRRCTSRSRTRTLRAALPRRLHLRGDRPDPRLVLLPARGQHARLRPHAVPRRRVPRAAARPGRPEDVEEPRATSSTRGASSTTAGADALRWNFVSASSPWMPKRVSLESIDETTNRFLLTLWNTYSFFVTYANLDGWAPARPPVRAPSHVLDRWIRSRLHSTVLEVTDALEAVRRAARRAVARRPRRRSLQLVRAPLALAVLERGRRRRARGAARVPADDHAAARAVLPVRVRRDVPEPRATVGVGAPRRLARRRRGRDRPAARGGHGAGARHVVSLGLAARTEVAAEGASAARPRARAAARAASISDAVQAEIADALEREAARDRHEPRGTARLLGGAELPPARPEGRQAHAAGEGAARRRRRRGDPAARSRPTAGSTSTVDGTTIRLEPDDVEVRATSHEELALAEDGGFAVALDTRLDTSWRSRASPAR